MNTGLFAGFDDGRTPFTRKSPTISSNFFYTVPSLQDGDPYFNYVTMLLLGNGSNGTQNNTFIDSSSNNFSITRNGNTTQGTFSPYESNWSNFFNGTDHYFSAPASSNLLLNGSAATVECWVYLTRAPVTGATNNPGLLQPIFVQGEGWWLGSGSSSNFGLYIDGTSIGFGDAIATAYSATYSPQLNTWIHIAATKTAANALTVYINGVSLGTQTGRSDFGSNAAYTNVVGFMNAGNGKYPNYFQGYISNLRILKGTVLYSANFTPPTAPLTAITNAQLLTSQSNRLIDNSTNSFAITAVGTPSVQRFSPFNSTMSYSADTIGGSGYFDGSGDFLSIADNAAFTLGSGDWTIEAWVFTGASATQKVVIGQIDSGGTTLSLSFQLDMSSTDYPRVIIASGTTLYIATSSSTLPKNQWVHLAGVRDGNTMRIYVNGVQTGTQGVTGVTVNDSSSNVGIGRHGQYAGLDWDGYISNLRLVKGTCVYPSGTTFTPSTSPLTAITNTSLLLNFTNAGIIDNAMINDLETVGNAQISTVQSKFGGSSISFDGTGDYLVSNSAITDLYAFGSGNFTIEFWLYLSVAPGAGGYMNIIDFRPQSTSGAYPSIYLDGSNATLKYYTNSADRIIGSNLATATWYHIALCRSGTSTRLFLNGTQTGSTYSDSTVYLNAVKRPFIGLNSWDVSTGAFNGYLDDLRITKGVARYTNNFTPPDTQLPSTLGNSLSTINVEYLVVAGGGGGGSGSQAGGYTGGGGGGAGGLLTGTLSNLNLNTAYTVTIGAGGNGGITLNTAGLNGSNSVFHTSTSTGGGGGGHGGGAYIGGDGIGKTGGSGGGSGYRSTSGSAGTSGQGNTGGFAGFGEEGSGGGGGAGAVGGNGSTSPAQYTGGAGGAGWASSITGISVTYAGGGGAGGLGTSGYDGRGGLGGTGGGGTGSGQTGNYNTNATAGTANSGGGGGGGSRVIDGSTPGTGASGGSGVVILKIPNTRTATFSAGITSSLTSSGGFNIYTVTAGSGTVTFT
jgi:hypothetical protein